MSHLNTFKRKELKFVLDKEKYEQLLARLEPLMTKEEYGDETICNIYFDNESDELIRNSLLKPLYKEKLRLRCYGVPDDQSIAYAEIKKKYKGIVYKRREHMPYAEAYEWLVHGAKPQHPSQVTDEIDFMIKRYGLKPKMVICYDRCSYYAKADSEFRLTFDSNIRSRTTALDLRAGCFGQSLLNQPYRIMELKTAGAVPMWMTVLMSELGIYIGSFSKYGNIYSTGIGITRPIIENNERESKKCFQVSLAAQTD